MNQQGNIRKRSYAENYVVISNGVAQCKDLTWEEKGMILFLQSLPQDWKIHKSSLHEFSSSGDHSTRNTFNSLVKKGYIQSVRLTKEGGKFAGWEHIFDVEKNFNSDLSTCGKPTNGKPNCGEPYTTKEIETKEIETKEIESSAAKNVSKKSVHAAPSTCTVEQAIEYAEKNGFNKEFAVKFHSYYVRCEWRDSQGKLVKNWKNRMNSWMSREDNTRYMTSVNNDITHLNGFSKDNRTGKYFRVWERDGKTYQCDSGGTFMYGEGTDKIPYNP